MSRRLSKHQQLLEASSLGLMFPIAIGIGFGWGYWMDGMFGTKPWLTWIFTGLGMIAAFVNLFRTAMAEDADAAGANAGDESNDGPDAR